jgi:hypothetical protein
MRRRFSLVLTLVVLVLSWPAAAKPAPRVSQTYYYLNTRSPLSIAGKPYTLSLNASVSKQTPGGNLMISLTRLFSTGTRPTETYTFFFSNVPASALHFDSDLDPVTVNYTSASNQMGKYGSISLHLTGPSATTVASKCTNGHVFGSTTSRSGTLQGTFKLNANDDYFHVITMHSLPALASKQIFNGYVCPGKHPRGCNQFEQVAAGGTDAQGSPQGSWSLLAQRPLPSGKTYLSINEVVGTNSDPPSLSMNRTVGSQNAVGGLTVSQNLDVTVNGAGIAPEGSGSMQFTASNPTTGTSGACKTTSWVASQAASSDFTVHFDSGGTLTIAQDEVSFASFTRYVKK